MVLIEFVKLRPIGERDSPTPPKLHFSTPEKVQQQQNNPHKI
jgi:hypothetical protein